MKTLVIDSKGNVANATTKEEVRFTGQPIVVSTKEDKPVSVTVKEVKPTTTKAGKDVSLVSKVAATTKTKAKTKPVKASKVETVPTPATTKATPDKAAKKTKESNEAMAARLLKEKATEEQILAAYLKVYKDKKGITDQKFIKARAEIYMNIAKKRAGIKVEPVKPVVPVVDVKATKPTKKAK